MKFTKINDFNKTVRSGRRGTLNASYAEIVERLGEPSAGASAAGKTQAEWILEFEDGKIATIYDYKAHRPVEQVTSWSIGGHDGVVVDRIQELFN